MRDFNSMKRSLTLSWSVKQSRSGSALRREPPVSPQEALKSHMALIHGHDREALLHEVGKQSRDPLSFLVICWVKVASHGWRSSPEAHVEVAAKHVGDGADRRRLDVRRQDVL